MIWNNGVSVEWLLLLFRVTMNIKMFCPSMMQNGLWYDSYLTLLSQQTDSWADNVQKIVYPTIQKVKVVFICYTYNMYIYIDHKMCNNSSSHSFICTLKWNHSWHCVLNSNQIDWPMIFFLCTVSNMYTHTLEKAF